MIQALSEIKQTPKEGLRVEQPFKIKSPCQIIHKMGVSKVAPTRVADAQGPHSGCGQELSILVGGKHFAVLLMLLCLVDSILGSSWLDCEHVWGWFNTAVSMALRKQWCGDSNLKTSHWFIYCLSSFGA